MNDDQIPDKFNLWNNIKKKLNTSTRSILFKEGEIWWCSLGINVAEETYGKGENFRRPVLIIQKLSRNMCVILPITTVARKGSWYYHINTGNIDRWIMLHQIRSISANRLYKRITSIPSDILIDIKKSEAILLGLFIESSPEVNLDRWVFPNVSIVYMQEELESMEMYEEFKKMNIDL